MMPRHTIEELRGKRVLLVANTGGHLNQLVRLEKDLGVSPDSRWVTFDTPQARSLLEGRNVSYVPYVKPRDAVAVARAFVAALPLAAEAEGAVSTGAGLALSVLPRIAAQGKPTVYIESISRVLGPSVTGRILARLPLIGMYAQHHGWLTGPWRPGPSVLGAYRAETHDALPPQRLFVTLGTIAPYRFDRLVDLVRDHVQAHPGTEVRWQLGCTDRSDLPGEVFEQLGERDFSASVEWADVVVAHAGVGVAMNIMDAGKAPVLLARDPARDEHVDGHQAQIHHYLVERGLAFDAADVFADPELLRRAAGTHIVGERQPDPIGSGRPE